MAIFHCPSCHLPLTDDEARMGACPACHNPFPNQATPTSPPVETATPAATSRSNRWPALQLGVIVLGFVALAALILAKKDTPPAPTVDNLTRTDLNKVETDLRALDRKIDQLAALAKKPDDNAALEKKLDQLNAKITGLEEHSQALRKELTRLASDQAALTERAFSPPPPPGPLEIRVVAGKWGDAVPENIQAVCLAAAKELWQHFPDRRIEPIKVRHDAKGPMVMFGRGPDGERRVLLHINGKFWAQCAYQFSHEFCHILCNYREVPNAHHWFEEALCETASLYTLRKMADSWQVHPPYDNWKSYSVALNDYSEEMMRTTTPLGAQTLAQWYAANEKQLQAKGTDRPRNRVVAVKLLSLLEKNPHHWQAVGYLNQWDPRPDFTFAAYLSDWHRRVPLVHKPFVEEVATMFAVKLG